MSLQALQMIMTGHAYFTSLEEGGDDNCIIDLDFGVFPEIAIDKNALNFQAIS